ncbi:MAG TPA: hypothetical protein VLC79_09730 [Cellvibrio sp.]|nr:hypothetical protein [Cellvibrio sp.]
MLNEPWVRSWLVGWLYLVALGHIGVAIGMTWWAGLSVFTPYHQSILAAFGLPLHGATMDLQLWWIALFGATLQAFALFMLALVYLANRHRCAGIWLFLGAGILLWVPQDIFISIQKNVWVHVWIDLGAVIALLVPLLALWWLDRNSVQEQA